MAHHDSADRAIPQLFDAHAGAIYSLGLRMCPNTDEAQDLVTVLRSGSLDAEITLQSEFAIGPSLGEAAIRRGMIATSHQVTNVLIEVDGGSAASEAYVTVVLWVKREGAEPQTEIVCRGR